MRNTKGITLIALIITIIVMLILVAVTVSVALNGGIFNNAREAKTGTQRQAEKEELIAHMVGAYNSSGNFATSNVGTLPGGAKWCNEDTEVWSADLDVNPTGNGDWIITKNNNKFYVDSSGSVLDEKPVETTLTLIPTQAQLSDAGEPDDMGGILIYAFDDDDIITYVTDGDSYMEVNLSIGGVVYSWYCNEETATSNECESCVWYKDGALYSGSSPISLSTVNNVKNEQYIISIIDSFGN